MSHTDIAERLFAAFAAGDVDAARSLCAADLKAIQNDNPPMPLDALLQFSAAVKARVPDFRYEERTCNATERGFVEEHLVRGTLPDGNELRIAACVVADVQDGQIQSLREYLDTADAVGLLKALRG